MPTSDEESRASRAVQDISPSQVTLSRGYQDNFAIGLIALVVAAGVVTLAGTFTAVGLATAESRADVATLAAVGASPAIRRRLAASQAGVISGFGSLLGGFSGVLAGWLLVRIHQPMGDANGLFWGDSNGQFWGGDQDSWRLVLPWPHLLAIGVGIPLLAAGVGFLTTRSRLPLVRRIGQ
jgi:putative ABC transport system permease protein